MKLKDRLLAITDVETTGLNEYRLCDDCDAIHATHFEPWHEICEIGLVLINQRSLEIVTSRNWKVKVGHPERISPEARKVNGYNETDWKDASHLREVLKEYAFVTKDAVFASHTWFDWMMMKAAATKEGVPLQLDYHRLDLWTYAVARLDVLGVELDSYRLSEISKYLGVGEEPMPHRAINGAMKAYEVYKALRSLPVQKADSASGCQTHTDDDPPPLSSCCGGNCG